MKIYRVPSSGVSFLNSGPLLHPILPRSQCWCVDEESKFVLRVREGSYYRIELPFATEDEKEKVVDFKTVLKTILHFERTTSPFSRGYNELVDAPQTPVRRSGSQQLTPAKRWKLNKFWEPEDAAERAKWSTATPEHVPSPLRDSPSRETLGTVDSDGTAQTNESSGDGIITEGIVPLEEGEELVSATVDGPDPLQPKSLPFRLRPISQMRSVTAPALPTLQTSSPHTSTPLSRIASRDADAISIASSHDSFYSMEDSSSPSVDAKPLHSLNDEGDTVREQFAELNASLHKRGTSDMTIIPDTPTPIRTVHGESPAERLELSDPGTPPLISDSDSSSDINDLSWADAVTPPNTLRLRHIPRRPSGTHHRRALEPLTPSFFSSPVGPSRGKLISATLVQKVYSILIGPPAQLVALMLEIAAKILKGIPVMYDSQDRRERLPGSWETSSADEEDEWGDEEDDFGIPLDNLRRVSQTSSAGHSSGVD